MNTFRFAVLMALILSACESDDDSPMGTVSIEPPPMTGGPGDLETGGPLPQTDPELDPLLQEAARFCFEEISRAEPEIAANCVESTLFTEALVPFAQAHNQALRALGLPGRGLDLRLGRPSDVRANDEAIVAVECEASPVGGSSLNAFALRHGVFILDPLMLAFFEGAALWGELALAAGGPEAVDLGQLLAGLGQVFSNADRGGFFQVIASERAVELVQGDAFTSSVFIGVAVFVIFHEAGHANMEHSMVNHLVRVGLERVLQDGGMSPNANEIAEATEKLRGLKVATETQADIYALSLMRSIGSLSSAGPQLFAIGMAGKLLVDGICDPGLPEAQLIDCITQDLPDATHPPLDVRIELARRILDEGEDLTMQLQDGQLLGLVPE